MAVIEIARIQVRRGQELQTGIPQLEPGEFGWAQDTENLYIGKRISEGASDDENTRILTENDLNYFKVLALNNTSTAASSYRYRENILASTTTTSVQVKLDSLNPSLVDFGVTASTGTYVQIDSELQNAINDLFVNVDPAVRQDRRRILEIPAGLFYLSNTVTLPPYTKLVGAGPGLTKILYTNSTTAMMKTVDIAGNTFETGNMYLTTGSCRDIVIEGITFSFSNSLTSALTLLSIDNVKKATVKDCVFQTEFNSESTTTYGIVTQGVGIHIRGQGDVGSEKCRDVVIENCEFNGLLTGVLATGTVLTPSINNSIFSNLNRGIEFNTSDTLHGPLNGYISYNRFQDILQEGIYVGVNPNGKNSSTLSTQNYFSRVGGLSLNEFTTSSSVTSVISYFSAGNKSVDDYFARRAYVESLNNFNNFYYNPFVRGTTTIADSAVYTKTVIAAHSGAQSTNTFITYVPLNDSTQMVTINYQLASTNQSRSGSIRANIDSNGNTSITDTYNYVETFKEDTQFIVSTTGSGINLLVVDAAIYPRFEDIKTQIGNWYITGENYPNKAAFIANVITSGTEYVVTTDSSAPAFDFNTTGTFTLLTSFSVDVASFYDTSNALNKNFVGFYMNNPNTTTDFILNYQVDIQT